VVLVSMLCLALLCYREKGKSSTNSAQELASLQVWSCTCTSRSRFQQYYHPLDHIEDKRS
jgi:hypothetical protein